MSLSAPKSIVLFEITPLKTMLSPPAPPLISAEEIVLENKRRSDPLSPETMAPLLTPAEVQGVVISTTNDVAA